MADAETGLAAGLAEVRSRIEAAGGDLHRVGIVAVTKGHGPATVRESVAMGLADVGESYAQELMTKAAEVESGVRWHMIGRLQRNKVRHLAGLVSVWQSIDRLSLAAEVARHAPGADVFVQVNVTGSGAQGGCLPERVAAMVEGCRDLGLEVRGLMAIGPLGGPDESRRAFAEVRELADRLDLAGRSMGMSGDLEAAVAEGATLVRVGTALFGPREARGHHQRPGAGH